MLFQKKYSPKKLSISEMWKLYRILWGGADKHQRFLIDEIIPILERISIDDFKSSMRIMYGEYDIGNLSQSATLFFRGIVNTRLFIFSDFMEMIRAK